MSAIGSVMCRSSVFGIRLPAALSDAGHVAGQRQLAEAQAAQRELAHVGARPAAAAAAVALAHAVLQRLLLSSLFRGGGHASISLVSSCGTACRAAAGASSPRRRFWR